MNAAIVPAKASFTVPPGGRLSLSYHDLIGLGMTAAGGAEPSITIQLETLPADTDHRHEAP
jgi:hypothetical protein